MQTEGFFQNAPPEKDNGLLLFLKPGVTKLRILPTYKEGGQWYRLVKEAKIHINGKFSPTVSPLTEGMPCPFAQEANRLQQEGGEANIELAKKFRPRDMYLYNVVVYETPDGPVPVQDSIKILKAGVKVHRQLQELNNDMGGGWGDITNLQDGVNIQISRTGSGQFDTEYNVQPMAGRSNVLEYLEQNKYQGTVRPHDLDQASQPKSFDELTQILETVKNEMGVGVQATPVPVAPAGPVSSPGGGVQFALPTATPVEPAPATPVGIPGAAPETTGQVAAAPPLPTSASPAAPFPFATGGPNEHSE
jgi:hypothetical protein